MRVGINFGPDGDRIDFRSPRPPVILFAADVARGIMYLSPYPHAEWRMWMYTGSA